MTGGNRDAPDSVVGVRAKDKAKTEQGEALEVKAGELYCLGTWGYRGGPAQRPPGVTILGDAFRPPSR